MKIDKFGSLVLTVKELRELLDKYKDNDEVWFKGYNDDWSDYIEFGVNEETLFDYTS